MSKQKTSRDAGKKPYYGERMLPMMTNLPPEAAQRLEQLSKETLAPMAAIARKFILAGLEQLEQEDSP
jgi:predicted DNA-binding protein